MFPILDLAIVGIIPWLSSARSRIGNGTRRQGA
jgi:hypothetical protein